MADHRGAKHVRTRIEQSHRRRMGVALAAWTLGLAPLAVVAAVAPSGAREATAVASSIPAPGSATASPGTAVTLTGVAPEAAGDLTVTGSHTGPHTGTLTALPQGQGVTFTPDAPFAAGEEVEVSSAVPVAGAEGTTFTFTVGTPAPDPGFLVGDEAEDAAPGAAPDERAGTPKAGPTYGTRSDLRPPGISIGTPATTTAPGLLFSTPRAAGDGSSDQGVMIYDDEGEVVWFRPQLDPGAVVGNAVVTTYAGAPALTWFEGTAPFGAGSYRGEWVVVDSTYREVARVGMANGYRADIHDIELTDHGTAYLIAYNPLVCTGVAPLDACRPGATVLEGVVQEVDVASGQVLWEWHSLDHVPLEDDYLDLSSNLVDYFHVNSVDIDEDGGVLLTARSTSAMYKLDRATGKVLWTFGGKRSSFPNVVASPGPPDGPDFPHDVEARGGGSYSWFDNGVRRGGPARADIATLDPATGTATFTKSLQRPNPIDAPSQGNMQPLPTGGNLVSWGNRGVVTEFGPADQVVFDATLPGVSSYRQYRQEWVGAPTSRPAARADAAPGGTAVRVSWNGDTRTQQWRILAGPSTGSLSPVATVARDGFETAATIPGRPQRVVVEALDGGGQVIGRSAPVAGAAWFTETAGPSVSGRYRPLVGDFGGGRNDDVVYYQPGEGPDFLHVSDGSGGFASTLLPRVDGDYTPLVGDFVGDDRDEVLWTRPGSGAASLWRFDLRPRDRAVAVASAGLLVPAAVNRSLVLDHRPSYGGGHDEVLFYAVGQGRDSVERFSWLAGQPLVRSTRTVGVGGLYAPIIGDYDGNGQADVLWYAPGSAPDYIWLTRGDDDGSTGQRSIRITINGDYQAFARNFAGSEEREEVAFLASGPAPDFLWTFDGAGRHTSTTAATSAVGLGMPLDGGPDVLMTWVPDSAPGITQLAPGTPTSRSTGNASVASGYYPIIGDLVGPVGGSDVLWYAAGGRPERLDVSG